MAVIVSVTSVADCVGSGVLVENSLMGIMEFVLVISVCVLDENMLSVD